MSGPSGSGVRVRRVTPLFLVRDVVRASEFYRDQLGFETLHHSDTPPFVCVHRDGSEVILKKGDPDQAPRTNAASGSWDACFWVDDLRSLRREFAERGTIILREPEPSPDGVQEMEVLDIDGHRLCFAQIAGSKV